MVPVHVAKSAGKFVQLSRKFSHLVNTEEKLNSTKFLQTKGKIKFTKLTILMPFPIRTYHGQK
jgi:hypothetical protein